MNKHRFWRIMLLTAGLFALLGAGVVAADGPDWPLVGLLTDLGSLGSPPSDFMSCGYGINDLGQVVGESSTGWDSPSHAFIKTPGGVMLDLGLPPEAADDSIIATGINNAGKIALNYSSGSISKAYTYSHGTWQKLATMGDLYESKVAAINQAGETAGGTRFSGGSFHACKWSAGGALVDLGSLPDSNYAEAAALNDVGQVAGWSYTSSGRTHAVAWSGGQIFDLGCLGTGQNSWATGINNAGVVVGYSEMDTSLYPPTHAFMRIPGQPMVDLGCLPYGTSSRAYGINNRGQITGRSHARWDSGSGWVDVIHAFIYAQGVMQDLGTFQNDPVQGSRGFAINTNGQVTGDAASATSSHAFFGVVKRALPANNLLLLLN